VNSRVAARTDIYKITTYTHIYQGDYGSPEVDQTTAEVIAATPSGDGLSVVLQLKTIIEDHIHDFDLAGMMSQDSEPLLHRKAYYTVNEIPKN